MTLPSIAVVRNDIFYNVVDRQSIGMTPINVGGSHFNTSRAWPTANLALFTPFEIAATIIARKLWVIDGATVGGNIDLGIYREDGVRLVSIGSTAQTPANSIQEFDIADTILRGPGRYYLAIAADSVTPTMFSTAPGAAFLGASGIVQQATAFPLATNANPATFAACVTNFLPNYGLSTRSLVV